MATIRERTNSDRTTSFQVIVRLKGYPTQRATFARKTDAKKWAQDTEVAIRDGRHFKTTEAKKHTLADMVDRYTRDVLPGKPKSSAKLAMQLKWWKEKIGMYTLADVTPALIAEHRDNLARDLMPSKAKNPDETKPLKRRSPSTVVRYLAALSHAFTIAVKEWGWLDDSPMRRVTKPKEPRGRVRSLDDDERAKLLDACKKSRAKELYPLVVLALSTGGRSAELMTLTWKQVDLNRGKITLEQTKNGERRALPLAGHALELLKDMSKVRRIDTNLLFPSRRRDTPVSVRKAFKYALQKAGITDFRFHDLRHSCASYLAMNGASLAEIAEVLGHKTLAMVQRYTHLTQSHTSGVVASMNEKIFGRS
jgi:integrase